MAAGPTAINFENSGQDSPMLAFQLSWFQSMLSSLVFNYCFMNSNVKKNSTLSLLYCQCYQNNACNSKKSGKLSLIFLRKKVSWFAMHFVLAYSLN
jgi:hypothetical protein